MWTSSAFADVSYRNLHAGPLMRRSIVSGSGRKLKREDQEDIGDGEEVEDLSGAQHIRVFWDTAHGNELAWRDPRRRALTVWGLFAAEARAAAFKRRQDLPFYFPTITGGSNSGMKYMQSYFNCSKLPSNSDKSLQKRRLKAQSSPEPGEESFNGNQI